MEVLNCQNLTRRVGNFELSDISFSLEPGYLLGVVGVNGSGKSTLLHYLMGGGSLRERTKITVAGCSMTDQPVEAKQHIAFVLNDCPFFMALSGRENMQIVSKLYPGFSKEKFMEWMEHFAVPAKRPLQRLSKGQQMKFQLAFALSYDADVYFMDEPSANLDVEFREEFYQIVRELIVDGKKSVVYVTQLVEELNGLADYILWMHQGKMLLYMDTESLQERFLVVTGPRRSIDSIPVNLVVGKKYGDSHNEALIDCFQGELMLPLERRRARIEEIMYYFEENPSSIRYFLMEHKEKQVHVNRFGFSYRNGGIYV